MNIRRQYNLPNCTLTLEGFDDGSGKLLDTLTILSNVECRFTTSQKVLSGGKIFFDHLVQAVSEYAQGILSGLQRPPEILDAKGQVRLETATATYTHHLHWQQPDGSAAETLELTTAELFDLTEAIDQFLADGLTLPDFVLPLTPLSRRHCVPEESFADRAVPPLVGVSGLALTAFALFFVPAPETTRTDSEQVSSGEETEQLASATLPDTALWTEADFDRLGETLPTIATDRDLQLMQAYLYGTLDSAWTERDTTENASYRLALGTDGRLLGVQPLADAAVTAGTTALGELGHTPEVAAIANEQAMAQFRVNFAENVLEVSPWDGFQSSSELDFDSREVEGETLRQLIQQVKDTIAAEFDRENATIPQTLAYTLGVTNEGAIAIVVADNNAAKTALDQTPLPALVEPAAAGIVPGETILPTEPLTQVNVVFQPNGVIEVSPWAGYR
ncbi:DUF4335 domain-containing protein [Picosynechococcus sp. PCC 7117]|uniref:DUF4335 domain-containing protein n=1 Tax=Picosynechococcus sp. PCC 7117 TaxID=195498 RepID=UPI000810890E|nr:DUF4335 domain-containing protein [Picosynechococcus sp. PCC 7117]ANV87210.1 hypothetical protein AWQ22_06900 [Picosynechococcus sp. PCC 7117]